MAVGLSDSNSTQDTFMELASLPDSNKKTFPDGRPLASCSDATAPGKQSLAPTEDRGKLSKSGALRPCAREGKPEAPSWASAARSEKAKLGPGLPLCSPSAYLQGGWGFG